MIVLFIFYSIIIILALLGQYEHYKKSNTPGFQEVVGHIVNYERRESHNPNFEYGTSITYGSIIGYEVDGVEYTFVRYASSMFKPKLGKKL